MLKKNNMVKKVPLKQFITLLVDIFEQGYDFVDLSHSMDGDRDVVSIQVLSAYIHNEEEEEDDDDDNEEKDINIDFDDIIT